MTAEIALALLSAVRQWRLNRERAIGPIVTPIVTEAQRNALREGD